MVSIDITGLSEAETALVGQYASLPAKVAIETLHELARQQAKLEEAALLVRARPDAALEVVNNLGLANIPLPVNGYRPNTKLAHVAVSFFVPPAIVARADHRIGSIGSISGRIDVPRIELAPRVDELALTTLLRHSTATERSVGGGRIRVR
jgi:hypothetical protein